MSDSQFGHPSQHIDRGLTTSQPTDIRTKDTDHDQEATMFALGRALRSVRIRKSLSLRAVEAGTAQEFKASVLGAYERGDRMITVPRLQRLAGFYRVPLNELLDTGPRSVPDQPRSPPRGDEERIDLVEAERTERRRAHGREPLSIDLEGLEMLPPTERQLLTRYLEVIVARRGIVGTRRLTVRADDVAVIARILRIPERRVSDVFAALASSH